MGMRAGVRGLLLGFPPGASAPADTTAPTVVITSAAAATVYAPFSCTFTFSEDVTGFTVEDITVGNGSAGTFATTSASVYTATITPTAAAVTVDVAAGVCTDGAGNANAAATQFARTYFSPSLLSGLGLWIDANDPASLFQDSAGTTPATNDGHHVGRAGRVASNLATQTVAGNRPTLKLNIQNGLPILRFDANDSWSLANLALLKNVASVSAFAVVAYPAAASVRWALMYGRIADSSDRFGIGVYHTGAAEFSLRARGPDLTAVQALGQGGFTTAMVVQSGHVEWSTSRAEIYVNGVGVTEENFLTDGLSQNADSLTAFVGARGTGEYFAGDLAELLVFVPRLSDANRLLVEDYLASKWGISF